MGLLIDHKLLFVHIPKTAGTFIIKNFKGNKQFQCEWEGEHLPLATLMDKCKTERVWYPKLTVFATVRDPWARMLSEWNYFKTIKFMDFYSGDESIDKDFNKWIKWIYSDDYSRSKQESNTNLNLYRYYFTNQLNWFKRPDGSTIKVDHIFKVEEFDKKLLPWFDKLRLTQTINQPINTCAHEHYSQYYNQESIDLVAKAYSEDIEMFDYDFVEHRNK